MKASKHTSKLTTVLRRSALAGALAAAVSAPSQALEFNKGDWLLNFDTTLGYSAQWRTENRDDDMEANVNGNDGNNNFDDGDMTSSKANVILEFGGSKDDFVFFIRADAMYDYIYEDGDSSMSKDNYLTYNAGKPAGGNVDRGDFPNDTLDEHGTRVRLLDAFAIYNFDVGEQQSGSFKAGRQVISWGGSRFWPGINGLQNPADGAVAKAPGVETKEIFLPTTAVDLKWDFTGNISAEAYYKLEWKETTQPGVGSYLSTSDVTGPGSERLILPPPLVNGKADGSDTPGDDGQWGAAFRYMTDEGWNFELAYVEAHANLPSVFSYTDFTPYYPVPVPGAPASFLDEVYVEDIKSWNFSVSGNISEAEIYADVFYSDDMPFIDTSQNFIIGDTSIGQLPIGAVVSDTERDEYIQVTVGMTDVYTAFRWLSPSIALLAEVIYTKNDLGESDLEDSPYLVTDDAWGYQFAITPRYFNVIQGMDVDIPITFRHDVSGYGNAIALGNGLEEDQKTAGIQVIANYLSNWQFKAQYAWYFDEKEDLENALEDRDNFSLSVKYRF
jgi:hypothetical protein